MPVTYSKNEMNVRVIDTTTGKTVLFATSERIAKNWVRESGDAPEQWEIVDGDDGTVDALARALESLVAIHHDWQPGGRATRALCLQNDEAIRAARAALAKVA